MKVLVICNCASGLYDFRGMLMNRLIDLGNEVVAIVPSTNLQPEKKAEQLLEADHIHLIQIPIERRGMNPIHDIKLMMTYMRVIRKEKPELVITYTIKPNVYGGMVCRLLHVPYAINITGLGTAFQNNGMLRRLVVFLYKAGLKRAKTVFFENMENQQIFLKEGIIRKEQACLLNGAGVDLKKFSFQPYPEQDATTRFLFIGRVMKEKGIDELFTAMRKLQKEGICCSLDVLGGFDEDYSKQIKECENEGWLHYHGVQSDVRPFIKNCHCFVLPSWHEGMANTNLECAASGRPVITSNIHGCLEAVEDGVSGFLCEKKNADDLYRVMKRFCALPPEEKQSMGKCGRERMEGHFDKRQVVGNTIQALDLEQ